MHRLIQLIISLVLMFPVAVLCQEEKSISNDQLEPMAYLVGGLWRAEGEIPGFGEFTTERSYEWALAGQFIEQRHVMKLPDAKMEALGIIGWHPDKKAISAWGFGSDGGIAVTDVSAATNDQIRMEGARVGDFNAGPIRSTFRKINNNEFLEIAEVEKDGEWVEMFTFRFRRTAEQ